MGGIMTNSEKVVSGRFGQGGRLRQVTLSQVQRGPPTCAHTLSERVTLIQ